jgi:hypothetical protein
MSAVPRHDDDSAPITRGEWVALLLLLRRLALAFVKFVEVETGTGGKR